MKLSMMDKKSNLTDLRVVFQQRADGVHLPLIESEYQSEKDSVKVTCTGHLSVNGHLHQGGTLTESAQRALDVYLKDGIDALCDAISGEFALLVLDRNKLYLIADLSGIVPLYWGTTDNSKGETHVVVSTSLAEVAKTLHSIDGKRLQPNKMFLSAFIADVLHLLDASHQTICPLEGIQRVPGSSRVALDLSTQKEVVQRYWDVNEIQTQQMDLSTAIQTLSDTLEASVRECFSHGKVAISLSGGIDSGSLAYFASEYSKSECICLTAGLDQWPEIDETSLAAKTAKHLGLDLHVVDCNAAFPFATIEPRLVYKYGLPVNILHQSEVCTAEAARQLGANVMVYGSGGDGLFGIGHTPDYISGLVRSAKFADAFRHLNGWMRRLGVSPFGAISAARNSRGWSPPALPPFLAETQGLIDLLVDTARNASNSIKERVRNLNAEFKLSETPWTLSAVYVPRNMRILNPFSTREVIEASFAIPQWFIQHPSEYKWLLRQLMKSKAPEMQFDPVGGYYDSIIRQGAILAQDRIKAYFQEECRLVNYNIVSSLHIKEYIEACWRDLDVLAWSAGGTGFFFWNAISAEMWLRGFEEEYNT